VARIGLVLGAGGVVGQAWHAGVLAAVAETTGWDPGQASVIVGTSAGSGVGAFLRRGVSAPDLLARTTESPLSPAGQRLLARVPGPTAPPGFRQAAARAGHLPAPAGPGALARAVAAPWRARPGVVAAASLPPGRISIDALGNGVRALYGEQPWPDAPLWICAVRLDTGELTVFGRDARPAAADIGAAVQASCAIPGVFAPVTIAGVRYVDGGAHSPTNADLLAREKLDLVVVSSPMSAAERGLDRRSALRAVAGLRLAAEVRVLRRRGLPVLTFQPTRADLDVMGWNAMDFARRAPVARQAFVSAERRLRDARVAGRRGVLESAGPAGPAVP
jgi:NTE family protein